MKTETNTSGAGGQAPAGAGAAEERLLRVSVNLDALNNEELREVTKRICFRGWELPHQSALRSFFARLADELTGVQLARGKAKRREDESGTPALAFGEVALELLAPPVELTASICDELRKCVKGCAAGAELVRVVVAALEAGRRGSN